ncbi:MAG: acylneuraminate cytidylyltransferase family protein [Actinobacteria bacterium]|nr:acylneuraminate cytidylyltransferase family protein [Actinomycetota bacterium]
MERVLIVIPARGGSKGIPGKNLREVAGRPLICWTIDHALEVDGDVRVVVSTDDPEIASTARAAGAEVPFLRPADLAVDTAPTEPAVEHAITRMANDGFDPDAVVLLQATSPVRRPGTVARAVDRFRPGDLDSLVGVVPQTPFIWHMEAPPRAEYDVASRPRRQDLTPDTFLYRETGSLYVTRTDLYRNPGNRIGGRVELFVMDEIEGIDIDSEADLRLADIVLRDLQASLR